MSQRKPMNDNSPPEAMWLTDEEIGRLKKLELLEGHRYHRREINAKLKEKEIKWECPYSIINGGDGLYAVYRNKQEDKPFLFGEGGTAKIKALQKLDKDAKDKGDWVLKTIYESKVGSLEDLNSLSNNEFGVLQKIDLAKPFVIETKSIKNGKQKRGLMEKRAKGKELFKLILTKELSNDSDMLKIIAFNILKKLQEMHNKGFILRDLKQQNIMVDSNGEVSFIDFGYWIEHKEGVASDGKLIFTRPYLPREVVASAEYTIASDIYAAGVVLRGLLTGWILIYEEEKGFYYAHDGITRITKQKYGEKYYLKYYILEKEIKDLIDTMNAHPKQRPTLEDACNIIKKYMPKEPDEVQQSSEVARTVEKEVAILSPSEFKIHTQGAQPVNGTAATLGNDEINITVLKEIVNRYEMNRHSYSYFSHTPATLDKLKQLYIKNPTATSVTKADVQACFMGKSLSLFDYRPMPKQRARLTNRERLACELADAFVGSKKAEMQLSLG